MDRDRKAQLFVGRLHKDIRTRDLEDVFNRYGKMLRCDIKYGAAMAYAFVDYDDKRDAEDAIKYENGRDLRGHAICVEWAKGPNYRFRPGGGGGFRDERRYSDRDRYRSSKRSRTRSRSRSPRRRKRSPSRSRSPTPTKDRKRDKDSRSPSKSRSRSASGAPRSRSGSRGKEAVNGAK